MKTMFAGSILALAVSFASLAADKTTTIKVSGWHCASCAAKTETAVKDVKGVTAVSADKDKQEIRVTYDEGKVKRADLEKAIADSGFTAAE